MLLQITAIGKEHFFMLEVCFVLYDASVLAGDNKASITVANNMSKYYHVSIVSLCGDHLNNSYKLADIWYTSNGANYGRTQHYNDSRYHMLLSF